MRSIIFYCLILLFGIAVFNGKLIAQEKELRKTSLPESFYDISPDIALPPTVLGEPCAGKRVRGTTPGWAETNVYHSIYLPSDWQPNSQYPIIVEYPGNGGYQRNRDISHGTVEDCGLGYGLTAGKGAIWVCMPFIDVQNGIKQNSSLWWGDVEETKRYCIATVHHICQRYGGDSKRVLLAGFSRGAIACFYIGLHDDQIAPLWAGFFCHSHFDGVNEKWNYPKADRHSALTRLKRLKNRPVWISQEGSTNQTERYLKETGVTGRFKFVTFSYPNHTYQWTLRDIPIRSEARKWWLQHFESH
ncbi:MAG: hypothetical protein LBT09_14840 [Planctomycetaceae bacterium]|jgi:hypothetical protein|nr:hypothetical protein [Planctomycetaceae bacterium]